MQVFTTVDSLGETKFNLAKGLLNWRILRPSMDSKHVRVVIWDFLYHLQNGTRNPWPNQKENSRFKIFFFILGLVAQRPKVQAKQDTPAVYIKVANQKNQK